ncbi:hypothetical protein M3J09_002349 [Ascochyta lentis]
MSSPDLLEEVIKTAHTERLRIVLLGICSRFEEARQFASNELLVRPATDGSNKRKSDDPDDIAAYRRFATCENPGCHAEYDTTNNGPGECRWHEGHLVYDPESDVWDDMEEATWGQHDTQDMREEYPEGFKWSCCGLQGDEEGCLVGPHAVRSNKKKKIQASSAGERA